MRVVLVGSGNVATHIALALKRAGIEVQQVWSKQIENAKKLADQIHAKALSSLSDIE